MKKIIIVLLILSLFSSCEEENTQAESDNQFILIFGLTELPGLVNNCPGSNYVVEKGIDYQIKVEKDLVTWFQFSPKGNMTPPEETREYFFTITKDSSATIKLVPWTSCKNFSSPSLNGLTPFSETPTELKFKIEKSSFQFPDTNRYRLELSSGSQTTVTVKQN